MVGWFLLSKRYWSDVFYTEIPQGMKEEDFLTITPEKGKKGRTVYIRKENMGKLFLA